MQNISLSEEFVKSVTKDELIQHFADNGYDWSETDIAGYWTKLNPTPKAEKPTKSKDKAPTGSEGAE